MCRSRIAHEATLLLLVLLFVAHQGDAFAPPFGARTTVTSRSPPTWQQQQAPRRQERLAPLNVQSSIDETTNTTPSKDTTSVPEYTLAESSALLLDNTMTLQKAINGAFLAACFGFCLYTILTIDAGMTRGWTQSEIAMRIPLDNWSSYESALLEKPIVTKTCINVVIYLLGDWLSQTVFQGNNVLDFDVSRTLKNGFIGLCFGPLVHLYYEFSDSILPVEGGLVNRASKILMDQTIYLTVKCSLYISAVGLLGGESLPTVKENVKERIGPVVVTAWKFWPLVHCITYGLIPARHRILWVNCVDLIWNAILASKAQGDNENDDSTEETNGEEHSDLVICAQDEALIQSIKAGETTTITDDDDDAKHVFDSTIQAELLELIPAATPEILMEQSNSTTFGNMNHSNYTAAIAPQTA